MDLSDTNQQSATSLRPSALIVSTRFSADAHPVTVYLARLGSSSRRTMATALNGVAAIVSGGRADATSLAWWQLRYQHTVAIRQALASKYAPATGNRILAALRGVLKECWRLGLIGGDEYRRAVDLPTIPGRALPAGRSLAPDELARLFAVCTHDKSAAGDRDAAILALLYGAGLRRSEAVGLFLADYEATSGEVRVRRGKGGKGRFAYLSGGGRHALDSWCTVRGHWAGPLLCPVRKGGNVVCRGLTAQAVLSALQKRAAQADVKPFSPHDCRRAFITNLLEAGADLSIVQELAGHSSITTTQRYDRRGEASKKRTAGLLVIPYPPPAGRHV